MPIPRTSPNDRHEQTCLGIDGDADADFGYLNDPLFLPAGVQTRMIGNRESEQLCQQIGDRRDGNLCVGRGGLKLAAQIDQVRRIDPGGQRDRRSCLMAGDHAPGNGAADLVGRDRRALRGSERTYRGALEVLLGRGAHVAFANSSAAARAGELEDVDA